MLREADTDVRRSVAQILTSGVDFFRYVIDSDRLGGHLDDVVYQSELASRLGILADCVNSPDDTIRDAALTVLCSLRDNRIVSPLSPVLDRPGTWRESIALAFSRLRFDQEDRDQQRLSETAAAALGRNLDPSRTSDDAIRQTYADALKRGDFPTAIPWLAEAIEDSVPGIRRAAAITLAKYGDQRGALVLLSVVRDATSYDFDAVTALCKLRTAEAVKVFEEKLKATKEQWERDSYLKAIREIDAQEAERVTTSLAEKSELATIGLVVAVTLGAIASTVNTEGEETKPPASEPWPLMRAAGLRLGRAWVVARRLFRKVFWGRSSKGK